MLEERDEEEDWICGGEDVIESVSEADAWI